jgi:c(7)-type cytochrome triheme protein
VYVVSRALFTITAVSGALLWAAPAAEVSSMPDAVRIPIVSPHPQGAPQAAALFRHGTHSQSNCYGCHPGLFPRYPLGFTHADMNQGSFCAGCHNGQGAQPISAMACEKCHVPK